MSKLNEEIVLEALKKVKYPGFSRDIVSFGIIKNLKVENGNVNFKIEINTSNPETIKQIEDSARNAVKSISGVKQLNIQTVMPVQTTRPQAMPPVTQILIGVKHKIAVASGKGGVGKSTVASNLAVALAKNGAKIGLLDADIYGPSLPLMFGVSKEKPTADEEKVYPLEKYGIKLISIGFFVNQDDALVWRGPMVAKALEQLMTDIEWGELDYLIIDLPPGTGDAQLTLSQKIKLDGAVIVTTPQDVALIDAVKGVTMFRKVNVPIIGIIENMSYFVCPHCGEKTDIFDTGGGERESNRLDVPFLGKVPIDPKIRIGGDEGRPIVASDEKSPQSKVFMDIARKIVNQDKINENQNIKERK